MPRYLIIIVLFPLFSYGNHFSVQSYGDSAYNKSGYLFFTDGGEIIFFEMRKVADKDLFKSVSELRGAQIVSDRSAQMECLKFVARRRRVKVKYIGVETHDVSQMLAYIPVTIKLAYYSSSVPITEEYFPFKNNRVDYLFKYESDINASVLDVRPLVKVRKFSKCMN